MEEWKILLTIGEIITFVLLIVTPLLKLTAILTELKDAIKELRTSFLESEQSNTKTHARIWNEIEDHGEMLHDHETRLQIIEKGGE